MIHNRVTKKTIAQFREILPSLILFAIYFIVDAFFSPAVSVPCVLLLGTAELIYTRIREKTIDKMILYSTLFFCIPGAIALFSTNPVTARLEPAIIETAVCVVLGIFTFSQANLTATLPAGFRKNINLTAMQQSAMKKNLRVLFFIFCTHTLLSVFALLTQPENIASFISTTLLFITVVCFFSFTFIHNRITLHRTKWEEWFPVVDEKGKIIGKAPRSVCHSGAKLLHPVVHLHIINEKGEYFLQKRSMKKDLLPGLWDTAVGGHIGLNEEVEDALRREAREELGITKLNARLIDNYIWETAREKELVFSFLCTGHDKIHIANDEVDEGRFWSKQEIENGIRQNLLTPNFIHEYKKTLKDNGKSLIWI